MDAFKSHLDMESIDSGIRVRDQECISAAEDFAPCFLHNLINTALSRVG